MENTKQQQEENFVDEHQQQDDEILPISNHNEVDEAATNLNHYHAMHPGMMSTSEQQQLQHHAHMLTAMQQHQQQEQYNNHSTTDPNQQQQGVVYPTTATVPTATTATTAGMDYATQQAMLTAQQQQYLHHMRFISNLTPIQQQQYYASLQAQRNPQYMKYIQQLQQKYIQQGYNNTTSDNQNDEDDENNMSGLLDHSGLLGSSNGGNGNQNGEDDEDEVKTTKRRGRNKNASSTSNGGEGGNGGSGGSKKEKKTRQRAVRHNWTQAQDDALMKAINSQQYSENGQKKFDGLKISQEVFGSKKLTPQSVYQRYMRVINPKLNHKEWTQAEDKRLTELYNEMGDQWAQIAKKMNGVRADVWIRQRAVRLGLISEQQANASANGLSLDPSTPTGTSGTSGNTPTTSKRKKKSNAAASNEEKEEKKKKRKSTGSSKKRKKKGEENLENEENDGNTDKKKKNNEQLNNENTEDMRDAVEGLIQVSGSNNSNENRSISKRKNRNPKKGNVSIIFKQVKSEEGEDTIINNRVYLKRKVIKNINKSLEQTVNEKIPLDEKYVNVSIKYSDIFRNFQPIPNHPLKRKNICLSSYRTLVEQHEQYTQLDVSFPTDLFSFFTKCKFLKNGKNSLFLCVALRQAALVHSVDSFSGTYPIQLRTGNVILQLPVNVTIDFVNQIDKMSDYPMELTPAIYYPNDHYQLNSVNHNNEEEDEDFVQLHDLAFKVNYVNCHMRSVERMWSRWDYKNPLDSNDEFKGDSFEQLKLHLIEKYNDRFLIENENRLIHLHQLKLWYQNVQIMDRKRLMLLDPSTMDVNELTNTQKQFMNIWNTFLLNNYKLMISDIEAFDACRTLCINEKDKLDSDDLREILAHQFLRLASLNVISFQQFLTLLEEAKITVTPTLQSQITQLQTQLQQMQQMQMAQQQMSAAIHLQQQQQHTLPHHEE
ncbi:hypothetical protein ABK040_014560 [Willaertia magna]